LIMLWKVTNAEMQLRFIQNLSWLQFQRISTMHH